MEIERKWRLTGFSKMPYIDHKYIWQSYLAIHDDCEVRVRLCESAKDDHGEEISTYNFTYKSGGTLSRLEVEKVLTKEQYKEIIKYIEKPAIFKDYFSYFIDYYKIEISKVDDDWFYAEVEFDSEDEANNYNFPWPELVIEEITNDDKYKMKNYWKQTRMKKEKK